MDGGAPPLWATLLTAWGATWSACWGWGWGAVAPLAARAAPFASSGHCPEDSERGSCDWELRQIIDLQQEVGLLQSEVWALRCLLLAGLLLLGAVASGAGTLGFLVGACRRCRCLRERGGCCGSRGGSIAPRTAAAFSPPPRRPTAAAASATPAGARSFSTAWPL